MFHPRGIVLRAHVRAAATEAPWGALAARLEGGAIVRLSSAWWKRREWPDVLGCAIRFTDASLSSGAASPLPRAGDQDLLFATILRPYTMLLAPLTTDRRDYFANRYYAVSPFRGIDGEAIEWRLTPSPARGTGGRRDERLAQRMTRGEARFVLEARRYRRAWEIAGEHPFSAVAEIELTAELDLDQSALRFDPFRAGRGIVPIGLIHALRPAAYAASQRVRALFEPRPLDGRGVAAARGVVVPTSDAARLPDRAPLPGARVRM